MDLDFILSRIMQLSSFDRVVESRGSVDIYMDAPDSFREESLVISAQRLVYHTDLPFLSGVYPNGFSAHLELALGSDPCISSRTRGETGSSLLCSGGYSFWPVSAAPPAGLGSVPLDSFKGMMQSGYQKSVIWPEVVVLCRILEFLEPQDGLLHE